MKQEIVSGYLARLKTIPCRYFEQSIQDSVDKFKCQFGNSCHYAHIHPVTKQPYVFSKEELLRSRPKQPRRGRVSRSQFMDEMAIMEMLFSDLAVREEWVDEDDLDGEDDFGDQRLIFERDLSGLEGSAFDFDLDFDDDFGYDWPWE
jgi:E3 ubiquitin-protein ligase makorin